MFTNAKASELAALVGVIDPDAYSAAAYETGYVDMSLFENIMAIAILGDFVSTGTADFKLQSSASASGGSDIAGKSITQLTQAGTDSNKQSIINLRRDDLPEGHRYVKAVLTLGTAGADMTAVIIGLNPRNGAASDNDLTSVDEIV